MDKYIIILLILILLSACKNTIQEQQFEYIDEEQGKATEIAINYLENSEIYKGGSNINLINTIRVRCIGCWEVYLQFDTEYGKKNAKLMLENWEIVDSVVG